ncbi:MAG: hypothetical protein R3F56_22875 [Planctomycetota bacterium]
MKLSTLASAALLLAVSGLPAQTTGVAGVNDLTMMLPPGYLPTGSGTVSCSTFVTTGATGTNVVAFSLDAPTASATFLLISPLGCVPQYFPFLPSAAPTCAGPAAGTPLTNLWLSLVAGGPFPLAVPGIINSAGMTRWNFSLGWPIPPLYVQGLMLDFCSPTTFKFSQAMGFQ